MFPMTEQARVTADVVDFIRSVAFENLPAEAIAIGKRCIIDALGVMLAGSTQDAASILRDYVRDADRRTEATAFGPTAFTHRRGVGSLAERHERTRARLG